jgi:hypothetical protein
VRFIKLAIISFLILFGILTAISLVIPSHIQLSKVITIKPEPDSIFYLIRNKDQWYRWHPFFLNGRNASILSKIKTQVLSETDSVLSMRWQQEGKKNLDMSWQLFKSNDVDFTTLEWRINFRLPWYPWQKIGSLFYEANYGTMMEHGLSNLKKEVGN